MSTQIPLPQSVDMHERYPIRTVSERTGVNAVTLRAWERRYGLITPLRTAKGHRLYTNAHISLIKLVCEKLEQGMSISQIASELKQRDGIDDSAETDIWRNFQNRIIHCIEQFDDAALDAVYSEAVSIYPIDIVTNKLIIPLLEHVGERWAEKTGSVAEEHFFSVFLRNKIGARLHHQNLQNQGKKIIAACLPGEYHEFGLLLFALSAHSRGYQIIILGANMPVEELPKVAERTQSDAIVLAGSALVDCSNISEALKTLNDSVNIPIFLGGDVSAECIHQLEGTGVVMLGKNITASTHKISAVID